MGMPDLGPPVVHHALTPPTCEHIARGGGARCTDQSSHGCPNKSSKLFKSKSTRYWCVLGRAGSGEVWRKVPVPRPTGFLTIPHPCTNDGRPDPGKPRRYRCQSLLWKSRRQGIARILVFPTEGGATSLRVAGQGPRLLFPCRNTRRALGLPVYGPPTTADAQLGMAV